MNDFKSGFVAIVGSPNSGKSTFLNKILKKKISITSKKAQTTRDRILGILNKDSYQIVFTDTPGIHKAKNFFNKKIVSVAINAINDADVILLIVDIKKEAFDFEDYLLKSLSTKKLIIALNKVDLVKDKELLEKISEKWSKQDAKVFLISSKHGQNVDKVEETIVKMLPAFHPYFPKDMDTDRDEEFLISEIIREKVFRLTGNEIPYSTAVTINFFKKGKTYSIDASIHVERNSQKAILIGKGASKIKKIGEIARADLERFFSNKVYLKLFVRVEKNWSKDAKAARKLGYS